MIERILEGQRVHHGGEHAHVIGRRAVHPLGRTGEAAKNVAAADDDRDLGASPRRPAISFDKRSATLMSMP